MSILKFRLFESGWTTPSSEVHSFIMDFYLDLVDEGIELTIEEFCDSLDDDGYETPQEQEADYRYSVTFKSPLKMDRSNGVETMYLMLKYGKMFYDSSITFENSTGAKIVNLRYTDNGYFYVSFSLSSPLIPS